MIFRNFVDIILKLKIGRSDISWMYQIVLMYKEYNHYFSLESLSNAICIIRKKSKIKIYNIKLSKHGLDQFQLITHKDFNNIFPVGIFNFEEKGYIIAYETLYDDEPTKPVKNRYKKILIHILKNWEIKIFDARNYYER